MTKRLKPLLGRNVSSCGVRRKESKGNNGGEGHDSVEVFSTRYISQMLVSDDIPLDTLYKTLPIADRWKGEWNAAIQVPAESSFLEASFRKRDLGVKKEAKERQFCRPSKLIKHGKKAIDTNYIPSYDADEEDYRFLKESWKTNGGDFETVMDDFELVIGIFEECAYDRYHNPWKLGLNAERLYDVLVDHSSSLLEKPGPQNVKDLKSCVKLEEIATRYNFGMDFLKACLKHWISKRCEIDLKPLIPVLMQPTVKEIYDAAAEDPTKQEEIIRMVRKDLESMRLLCALIKEREIQKKSSVTLEKRLFEYEYSRELEKERISSHKRKAEGAETKTVKRVRRGSDMYLCIDSSSVGRSFVPGRMTTSNGFALGNAEKYKSTVSSGATTPNNKPSLSPTDGRPFSPSQTAHFTSAVLHNDVPLVFSYLNEGLNPNMMVEAEGASVAYQWNFLHAAAYWGSLDVLRVLIFYGGDIESTDSLFGSTPLAWAAYAEEIDIAKMLVKDFGARTKHVNSDGKKPIDLVSELTDSWAFLGKERRSSPSKFNRRSNSPKIEHQERRKLRATSLKSPATKTKTARQSMCVQS
eukprot:Nk52_evm9s78 gene=Nk52_evmTU9s78